jgi:hypothetical protein
MQTFPLESIDTVISFLNSEDLARYACLSTNFCSAIERRTFQSITFKITELKYFGQLFYGQRRRSILEDIVFRVILLEYEEKYYARYERRLRARSLGSQNISFGNLYVVCRSGA